MNVIEFKKRYCEGEERRVLMVQEFDLSIDSFEALLPGMEKNSYASGTRKITDSFMIFKAVKDGEEFSPVFSESVGRKLAASANLSIPVKLSILKETGGTGGGRGSNAGNQRKKDNAQMVSLIAYARFMMIFYVNDPRPMNGVFKSIYDKLVEHPRFDVFESDIKSVNTAIGNYLSRYNDNRKNNRPVIEGVNDFIEFLQHEYPNIARRFRNADFGLLREKFILKYPDETVYF